MGNEFFGFSPEAFEQFVRVLAISVFGPGVTAFGNGPDGGREATFRGEVPYPYPPAARWSGYGVIQAKCKEKPESTKIDKKWALGQLDSELKAFVTSLKRNPKPEYYVFVTNVELSSSAGGARDRADELIRSYYDRLPLKGHAVWDANQLNGFLAKYEEIRRRFTAYLTTGDVLAAMLAQIEKLQPNGAQILTALLERELRADAASRLDQAGNRTEEQLRLAHLFFDLPASTQPQLEPPQEKVDADGKLPHGILFELLQNCSRKHDPKAIYEQESSKPEEFNQQFPARYVLLGGPGSGKSTVGQFMAQIHRAALLNRQEPHHLEAQTRQIIRETRDLCDRERLPWPATPRYPIRVELNRFAKALASRDSDHVDTFGAYLLKSLKPESVLSHETLLEWLATYPWLLILDGLDEVPATSNREALVKAVNDFLAEARQVGADLFVVATSRLQGYSGEFSSGVVAIRHILPLSTARALRYVERYAKARFELTDPVKAQDIVDKLRQSASRKLTAQLMVSPLQVTFMATVVAAKGDPGEDRWQLFESYYRTIYDRERQKAVPPYDAVLSKQQSIVDRLHHDIGFWLQFRGETAGGEAVSLPIAQFEDLVDVYLTEIGREGDEKDEMVKLIVGAARDRLIFLTSRVVGELSFDVRSLQEYMAAECLMSGAADVVTTRLKAIAPVPYWRNVFLFAASKCFADTRSRHLQDSIQTLCDDLNSPGDQLLAATRAGSELAIDILQSGAASQNPNHSRRLARLGLAVLSQPFLTSDSEEVAISDKLGIVYSEHLKNVYREELELRIGQSNACRTAPTWPLVARLTELEIQWATELAERHWPTEIRAQVTVLRQMPENAVRIDWIRKKMSEVIWQLAPSEVIDLLHVLYRSQMERPDPSDPLTALLRLTVRGYFQDCALKISDEALSDQEASGVGLRIAPAFMQDLSNATSPRFVDLFKVLDQMPEVHAGWLPFANAHRFLQSPNSDTLATILNECADAGWNISETWYLNNLPWPFANCLRGAKSSDELRELAHRVQAGTLGDYSDWKSVEDRWISKGVNIDELVSRRSGNLALDEETRFLIPPLDVLLEHKEYSMPILQRICAATERMNDSLDRDEMIWLLCAAGSRGSGLVNSIAPPVFRGLCQRHTRSRWWSTNYVGYPTNLGDIDQWLEFFDWLGCSDALSHYYHGGLEKHDSAWCNTAQRAFLATARPGLLCWLGRMAADGYSLELIPPEMLDSFSHPRFKLAAILVRMTQRSLTQSKAIELASEAAILLDPPAESGADELVFRTASEHLHQVPALENFLLTLRERIPATVALGVANCERLLRQLQRKRASELQAPDQLRHLRLPTVPSA